MLKKIFALFVCLLTATSLCACGIFGENSSDGDNVIVNPEVAKKFEDVEGYMLGAKINLPYVENGEVFRYVFYVGKDTARLNFMTAVESPRQTIENQIRIFDENFNEIDAEIKTERLSKAFFNAWYVDGTLKKGFYYAEVTTIEEGQYLFYADTEICNEDFFNLEYGLKFDMAEEYPLYQEKLYNDVKRGDVKRFKIELTSPVKYDLDDYVAFTVFSVSGEETDYSLNIVQLYDSRFNRIPLSYVTIDGDGVLIYEGDLPAGTYYVEIFATHSGLCSFCAMPTIGE